MSGNAAKQQEYATTRERDLDLILGNRHQQVTVLGERIKHYQDALNEIIGAVSLREAKKLARRALDDVVLVCACGHQMSDHDQYGCLHEGCCTRKGATVDV